MINTNDYADYEAFADHNLLMTADDYAEYRQCEAEAATEQAYMEWLERKTPEDEAFEQWERDRGCHLDPQSGY